MKYEYRRIDVRTRAGIEHAERMQARGWRCMDVLASGKILMERAKKEVHA